MDPILYKFPIKDFTFSEQIKELRSEYLGEYYQATHRDGTRYLIKFGPVDKLSAEFDKQIPLDGILTTHHPYYDGMRMAIPYENPYEWTTLKSYVDKTTDIPVATILGWAYDILSTLSDLQDYRIYHNNLCMEGSLLCTVIDKEKHIKLTGLSSRVPLGPMESRVPSKNNIITPCSTPEHINGQPLERRTDVWSLGVILYYCCCRKYPFGDIPGELANNLDDFKNNATFKPIPAKYSVIGDIISKYMLKYDYKQRYTPFKLLQLDEFRQIAGFPIKMGHIVCRSNKCNYKAMQDGGIYKIGQVSITNGKRAEVYWHSHNSVKISNVPDLELCTRNFPDSGLIPLTKGDKVIRGPDWDDDANGINDAGGLGTVVKVVPGFSLDFNSVNVMWQGERVVRYFYGITGTVLTAQILPAYPPIVPGMIVHNLTDNPKFNGTIISVSDDKDSALIELDDGTKKEMLYGKNNSFHFTVDEAYYKGYLVQSVEKYTKNYLEEVNDIIDDLNFDEEAQLKSLLLKDFRQYRAGAVANNHIEVGMFVKVPPDVKNCMYCRVTGIKEDGIHLDLMAICASYTIPVTKPVARGEVKQCTYGTPTHLPASLGSKIIDSDGNSGVLEYIASASRPKNDLIPDSPHHKSWKYGICKMQSGYQCFKFDEIKETK